MPGIVPLPFMNDPWPSRIRRSFASFRKFQWVATASAGSAWTVPASTVQMRVEGPHVAVVTEANHVELRSVTLGRDLGGRIVVSAGINGDERLVVNPTDDLQNGASVRVDEAKVAQR